MTQTTNLTTEPKHQLSWTKPVLIGAAVGFLAISFFVFGVDNPHPEWGAYWRVRPLIITPLAGATGGAFYAFMDYPAKRGFNRILAILISLVVFIIGLWIGVVLGLDGTMWD